MTAPAGGLATGAIDSAGSRGERAPRRALLALLAVGALVHAAILVEALLHNPLARWPVNDAAVYWDWAGRIAAGEWLGRDPFFSAPLYPYLVALLRLAGGGLAALYVLQLGLHLASAALLARAGSRAFGPRVGWLAAALWLLATGPAHGVSRVLAGTLQTFLMALALERAGALAERPGAGRAAALGAVLGALALAWPPAMAAVPVLALWAWAAAGGPRAALALAGAGALAIAPATLHNLAASGEWIPVSAHGGLTFYHGNNPSANGTFSPCGLSGDKATYHLEARAVASQALGRDAGWRDVSSYFFGQGLAWWSAEPARAAGLALKKAWWFLSGRHYGDMYLPTLERADGLARALWLTPVPVAWLALPGLLAAVVLVRRDWRRHLPALALAGLPAAVCTVFWYTPRYRLPAAPVLALLTAWALVEVGRRGAPRSVRGVLAGAFFAALLAGPVNRWVGMDRPATFREEYDMSLGDVAERAGELEEAERRYRAAARAGHPDAGLRLANLLRRRDPAAALESLRMLAEARPGDGFAARAYAVALAQAGRPAEAASQFERALGLDADDARAEAGLGAALVQLDRAEEALSHFERASALHPGLREANFNRGVALARLGRTDEALAAWRAELALQPDHEDARRSLVQTLTNAGRHREAVAEARAMLETRPGHTGARLVLAWLLATSHDDAVRDGAQAVELAEGLEREAGGRDPAVLDTLAAALAERGDLERAVAIGERAATLWRRAGHVAEATAVEERVAGYRAGRSHRE